jgi:hypothetical protein
MQIDESDRHLAKAELASESSFDPDSNVTVAREEHSEKQPSPMALTDEGMQMDKRDEHLENARSSICPSREPDSNATLARDSQSQKQRAESA